MGKLSLSFIFLMFFYYTSNAQTVSDVDGNVYETVTIGTQCWMKQNLKTTKYRDGSPIELISDSIAWGNDSIGAFCYFNNKIDTINNYGALYNYYAANNTHQLAPEGWHIPTDAEWETLVDFLGSGTGGQLKEIGTTHWKTPNTGASNSSNFTALGAGYRGISGTYYQQTLYCSWWSTTAYSENSGWSHELYYISPGVLRVFSDKNYGFSIRCIKDVATNIENKEGSLNINVYPNPAQDILKIESTENGKLNFEILNMVGQSIFSSSFENKTFVDLSSFESGIYYIRVYSDKNVSTPQFIKFIKL
ncbi:MAG: FISUMP domain-containing protein [Bacteroidota bacterium]